MKIAAIFPRVFKSRLLNLYAQKMITSDLPHHKTICPFCLASLAGGIFLEEQRMGFIL